MELRLEFARDSRMMYLSHLDLMRVFARTARRGGVPVRYSSGFNPHAEMVFGLPLQVGVSAGAECVDIALESGISPSEAAERLNAHFPPGLRVNTAREKPAGPNVMAQITHAAYIMRVCLAPLSDGDGDGKDGGAPSVGAGDTDALGRAVAAFLLPGPRLARKETKKAARDIDLAPLVRSLEAHRDALHMTVRAGSVDNVKPDLVLVALNELASVDGAPPFRRVALHRGGIFVERGGALLSPLDARILSPDRSPNHIGTV